MSVSNTFAGLASTFRLTRPTTTSGRNTTVSGDNLAIAQSERSSICPSTRDPDCIATLEVLTLTVPAANFTDENLFCVAVARMASLSLQHGNGDASCHAYVWLGMILRSRFGNFEAGFRFGRLGIDLVERQGLDRFKARIYSDFGHLINPWTRRLRGRS